MLRSCALHKAEAGSWTKEAADTPSFTHSLPPTPHLSPPCTHPPTHQLVVRNPPPRPWHSRLCDSRRSWRQCVSRTALPRPYGLVASLRFSDVELALGIFDGAGPACTEARSQEQQGPLHRHRALGFFFNPCHQGRRSGRGPAHRNRATERLTPNRCKIATRPDPRTWPSSTRQNHHHQHTHTHSRRRSKEVSFFLNCTDKTNSGNWATNLKNRGTQSADRR